MGWYYGGGLLPFFRLLSQKNGIYAPSPYSTLKTHFCPSTYQILSVHFVRPVVLPPPFLPQNAQKKEAISLPIQHHPNGVIFAL